MVKLRGKDKIEIRSLVHTYSSYIELSTSPVDKNMYYTVIGDILLEIRNYMLGGGDWYLPFQLGVIGIRWNNTKVYVKKLNDGRNVVRGLPINWIATLNWYKDNIPELANASLPEIRKYIKQQDAKDKVIIKTFNEKTQGKSASIRYFKNYPGAVSKYKSKKFKSFKPGRLFRVALANAIKENPDIPFAMRDKNIS